MVVSISLLPSVHDQHSGSKGLCGTLDNDATNDFHDILGDPVPDELSFIKAWRLALLFNFCKKGSLQTLKLFSGAIMNHQYYYINCFRLDVKPCYRIFKSYHYTTIWNSASYHSVKETSSLFNDALSQSHPWRHPACSCSAPMGSEFGQNRCHLGADGVCTKGQWVGNEACVVQKNETNVNTMKVKCCKYVFPLFRSQ